MQPPLGSSRDKLRAIHQSQSKWVDRKNMGMEKSTQVDLDIVGGDIVTATDAMTMPHHKFSLHSEHSYVKIAMFSEDGLAPVADVKQLKFAIDNTLKTAFGVVGASTSEFSILAFNKMAANSSEPSTALLRVQRGGLETLRGAITMCTTVNGKLCKLEVLHIGDSLMDMASGRFL